MNHITLSYYTQAGNSSAAYTMVATSPTTTVISGTAAQTIRLPAQSTLTPAGYSFYVINTSTATVTIQNSTTGAVATLIPSADGQFISLGTSSIAGWTSLLRNNTTVSTSTSVISSWNPYEISVINSTYDISNSPATYWHSIAARIYLPAAATFTTCSFYQANTNTTTWGAVLTSTSAVLKYTGTLSSSATGVVTLTFSSASTLTADTMYYIWICALSPGSLTITVGSTYNGSAYIMSLQEPSNNSVSTFTSYDPLALSPQSVNHCPWVRLK